MFCCVTVELLDGSLTVTGRLKLPSPFDVSVIDSSNVIVSLPSKRQLQVVQVYPTMKVAKTITQDTTCFGVAISREEIYTACYDEKAYKGEVRILVLNGNVKRRLGINTDGSRLFSCPRYITVSAFGEKIFVSDESLEAIIFLSSSGRVIYTYKDKFMNEPSGLICDSADNLLACGEETNNIHKISPDGNRRHILLAYKDGLVEPTCIAYKESKNTLIVGCCRSYTLRLFKLA